MSILFIHAHFGWFVGEFGKGGAEFSVAICAICLLLAAMDRVARQAKAGLSGAGLALP